MNRDISKDDNTKIQNSGTPTLRYSYTPHSSPRSRPIDDEYEDEKNESL